MCGIGGYVGERGGIDEQALLHSLRHRGPDAEGQITLPIHPGAQVHLAFARLAILDLSPAGNQPMSTEDGAATLVYNGESYNFAALRAELIARGHRFRSTSDTEVVLRGYREWGEHVVERLRGMFAFALWDAGHRRLQLFRDRLGKKPLYYCHDRRRLAFASELKALLACGAAKRRLDPRAVHGYLALGSVPQPRTLLEGVSLLLPGHVLTVSVGRVGQPLSIADRPYFHLPTPRGAVPRPRLDRARAAAEIAPVLAQAVALRLVADVPVGVLLSGGIDSTAVAQLARRAGEGELHTFTLTYGAAEKESEGDEARRIAAALHTRHHEHVETPAAILARLPAYFAALDQPSVDGLNTYLVAQVVRDAGLKVALSGLGGDEVFLGYDLRRPFAAGLRLGRAAACLGRAAHLGNAAPLAHAGHVGDTSHPGSTGFFSGLLQRAPLAVGKGAAVLSAAASADALRLYAALRGLFPAAQLGALLDPDLGLSHLDPAEHLRCDIDPDRLLSLPPDELLSYLEIANYLANTLLRDADVMSMAHGVELRVPLCDHILVTRVMGLPPGSRTESGRKKPLFVDACQSHLVTAASKRRKRGFVLPLDSWLRGALRHRVGTLLGDPAPARAAGLCPDVVSRMWDDYVSGRSKGVTWRIWALYTLLSWVKLHGLAQ